MLQKGGSAMNLSVILDWKFVVALGAAVSGIILASKMDSVTAERVSIHVIDACKGIAVADLGSH